jgi:O-antigen/teichoic acid export membrane protein
MTDTGTTTSARSSLFTHLLKGTALYSIALFSYRVASMVLLPITTRFLTPTDYAVLSLLEQTVNIASILLGLNVSAALAYFYFQENTLEERNEVASTTILGALLIGIAVALIGCVFARPVGILVFGQPSYTFYLVLMFLSLPIAFILEAELSWLRVADRPNVFAGVALIRVAVNVLATIALVAIIRLGVLGVISSSLTAGGVTAVVLTTYCVRRLPFSLNFGLLYRMFRFSIPLSLGSIALFIIHFGDRFILPHYRQLAELGIYDVAYKVGMLISLLVSSFITYWGAQIFPVSRREDANEVIGRIFTYVLLALTFCSLALIVFSWPLIQMFTSSRFEQAATIAPLIIIAYYFRALAEYFRCFFILHGRPDCESICNWIGAAVCITGYFVLIPRFGMWGAATATAVTFLVIGIISAVWSYRLKPYHLEFGRILRITVVFVALLAIYWLIPIQAYARPLALPARVAVEILWGSLLLSGFAGGILILRVASPSEITQFKNLLRMARGRALRLVGVQA